ncbi:MAG: repressor LexA [Gammaproteobacteria bacterium]|uniref:Repressor LexA n=1 Tax=Candidatus Thiopontia autotrophica TaxID=2841688 RepID=A0A8J6P0K6_9GAMM|nr:repressor LexA [Candidatus Thiopontia autotrophica]MBL6969076.1 repressor LexA [Gammaproteobacteria bacterium]
MSASLHLLTPKGARPLWSGNFESEEFIAEPLVEIPLLGKITAGLPIEAVEDQQMISVPQNMVRKDTYALRVVGESMVEDNIQDGDVIVVERQESAANGQSVVAMINNEEVTLKKLYIEKDGVRLQPANSTMAPIFLRNEDVKILGIVSAVIRIP